MSELEKDFNELNADIESDLAQWVRNCKEIFVHL